MDESQAFRSYIQELVDDVLSKALYDYNGSLCLIGTPGPLPSGYFFEASQSNKWAHHAWTMLQNPHLELKSGRPPMELIEEDCKRMGVSIEDSKIQRECFARWMVDTNSLVFRYSSDLNHFTVPPVTDNHVIGVDLGFHDADAIAVIGWKSHDPRAYLVEEVVKAKQGVTELAETLLQLIKRYDPLSMVMDTGGLGKKIAEELRKRYSLPIKAAEKTRKFEYIELLNDAMRTARFYARSTGPFAGDSSLVEWDKDRSSGDRLVVSGGHHSDIADAVLYGFRESLHWIEVPKAIPPARDSIEWAQAQEAEMVKTLESQISVGERDPTDPANWQEPEWD